MQFFFIKFKNYDLRQDYQEKKKTYSAILAECNFLNLIKIINQKLEAINSPDTPILKWNKR